MTWALLTSSPRPDIDFLRDDLRGRQRVDPGRRADAPRRPRVRHGAGGRLGVTVGFDTYELEPGDSISFESSAPTASTTPATSRRSAIWVVVGRGGDPRADSAVCSHFTLRLSLRNMERTLIRHAHVVSLDTAVGGLPDAEILIEGETIAAIGTDLGVTDAATIDARGAIAIPGFVDTHRHTWEAVLRGIEADATLADYFDVVLDTLAPRYRPDDVYAGDLLGALDALDGGITTLLDWSHISNTPEHSDEAIRALRDAGLRAVYCCGTPNTSVETWWTDSARPAQDDVRRIRLRAAAERQRPDHDVARRPRSRLLPAGGRRARLAAGARAGDPDLGPRRLRPGRAHIRDGQAAARAGAARPRHDLHPRQPLRRRGAAPDRRRAAAPRRSRRRSRC